jgi:hypothetical protein
MSFLSKNAALLVALSIAVVGFSNIANATPFGVSEIAKNHDLPLNEGAKNHGAVVSEAAKQQGGAKQGGLGSLNYQGTFSHKMLPHRKVFQKQERCSCSAQDSWAWQCGVTGHVEALSSSCFFGGENRHQEEQPEQPEGVKEP